MNLGNLKETLEALDPDLPIKLDDETGIGIISWRGDYMEASLCHGGTVCVLDSNEEAVSGYTYDLPTKWESKEPALTVRELISAIKLALLYPVEGYKGGLFQFELETPVWCAEYGEVGERSWSGVLVKNGFVHLLPTYVSGLPV